MSETVANLDQTIPSTDFRNATTLEDQGVVAVKRSGGLRVLLALLGIGGGVYAAYLLLALGVQAPALKIAAILAFAGGLLSTWSPCGYSSLSLLRPHGPYGARAVAGWLPTLAAHWLGYAIGAIVLGGGLGLLAWLLPIDGLGGWPLAVIGLLAVGYGCHCLGLLRMPYFQRRVQVSHGARNRHPMWVTGLIYGIQLGLNFVTYVRTPILYIVVALAVASGSMGTALLLIAVLNFARWAPLLVNGLPVRDQDVQAWLASNGQNAKLADGLLLAAVGAAFVVLGAA